MAENEGARPLRVVVVDDEGLARADILDCVEEVDHAAVAAGFADAGPALAYAAANPCDLALLDIEMPGMGGMELARRLAEESLRTRVVFVTSYDEYALEAFGVRAQGYLLKPVDTAALARELAEARAWATVPEPASRAAGPCRLSATTFGGFEASVDGERLTFKRARAKELLALLIDHRGAGISMREAISRLWPDEPYSNAKRSNYQNTVASLRATLREAGAEEVLVKSWNSLAVDPSLVDCDLYRFLDGDPLARASFRGAYLPRYEWAESTAGELEALRAGE